MVPTKARPRWFSALVLATACARVPALGDTSAREELRAVHEEYRRAWLANDAEAVLRLFAEDAVLLPHHGLDPVVGRGAIRAFWLRPTAGGASPITCGTTRRTPGQ